MSIDYEALLEKGQTLADELDAASRENPDDADLKEMLRFLADRLAALVYFSKLENVPH